MTPRVVRASGWRESKTLTTDRTEDLLAHQLQTGFLGDHDRRLDEVALAVAEAAAEQDPGVLRALGVLDVAGDRVVRIAVDDRSHEVGEVVWVAHADLGNLRQQSFLQARPQ